MHISFLPGNSPEMDTQNLSVDFSTLSLQERYKYLCGAIIPRPIAWISTVDEKGVKNLAPCSFFAPVTSDPPTVMFSITVRSNNSKKDTINNIESVKDFVINHVTKKKFLTGIQNIGGICTGNR